MDLPLKSSLDQVLSQLALTGPPNHSNFSPKAFFWGDGVGGISSYVAGWMAGQGMGVIVLDGANRFDPYMVSSFARRVLIPPEKLLKRIRIARAFTCYQMATLVGERLISLVGTTHAFTSECGISASRHKLPLQKPWVVLLGPVTTFLDEDVPEREVRPLLERSLTKIEGMAMEGIPFLLFQPSIPPYSKRPYLMRRLFEFSNLVWRISLDDQGPQLVLEKRLIEKYPNNKHLPSPKQLATYPPLKFWNGGGGSDNACGLRAGRPNLK